MITGTGGYLACSARHAGEFPNRTLPDEALPKKCFLEFLPPKVNTELQKALFLTRNMAFMALHSGSVDLGPDLPAFQSFNETLANISSSTFLSLLSFILYLARHFQSDTPTSSTHHIPPRLLASTRPHFQQVAIIATLSQPCLTCKCSLTASSAQRWKMLAAVLLGALKQFPRTGILFHLHQ